MNDNEKLIDRVRKLLALADPKSGATEAEAAVAAAKVQELLQNHGLSMAQVEGRGAGAAHGKRSRETTTRRAMYKWQVSLMAGLAANNFCMHFVDTVNSDDDGKWRRSKRHVLLGRDAYIEVTLSMYDYLCAAVRRAATDHGFDHRNNETDHHVFLDGAASRLVERLTSLRRERERAEEQRRQEARTRARHPGAAPTTGTELVLAEVYQSENDLNEDLKWGYEPGTTAARRAEREARYAAQQRQFDELAAQGIAWDVAYYMIHHGKTRSEAEAMWELEKRGDAERAKREERNERRRQSRGSGGYRYTKAERDADMRVASHAFQAGRRAADDIGLDAQVSEQSRRRLG